MMILMMNMCKKRNRAGLHIFRWACRDVLNKRNNVNKLVKVKEFEYI